MSPAAKKTSPAAKLASMSAKKAVPAGPKTFIAVLEPLRNGLGWVIARIPFDVNKAWPERVRQRVRGEVEGVPFRSSLFGFPQGDGHYLLVNNKVQKAAKATIGSRVRIEMEPD